MKLSNAFATATAALLMIGAAGCSTAPTNDQTQTAEQSAADTLSHDSAAADPVGGSAPVSSVDAPVQDPTAAPMPQAPVSAPSSLGASSSGRGH